MRGEPTKPRVAIDAMGAECGVDEVVEGALRAAAEIPVTLVGDGDRIERALDGAASHERRVRIDVAHAADVITNDEEPVRAVRTKQNASVVVGMRAVADGGCDALVSAGSTGATLAAAVLALKRLKGVRRPAVSALLPLPGMPALLLDVGANVEVRPDHLVQFAHMGAAFAEVALELERPRVALLSVGEEPGKGTETVVEAHGKLAADAAGFEFVGNIEGRDLTTGAADVVVTDGFTGNIALKLMEGTARTVIDAIRNAVRSSVLATVGGALMRTSLTGLRSELDPNTTGGAILLGLNAPVVIAHGNATADGIANATRLAARAVSERLVERTGESLALGGALRQAGTASEAT